MNDMCLKGPFRAANDNPERNYSYNTRVVRTAQVLGHKNAYEKAVTLYSTRLVPELWVIILAADLVDGCNVHDDTMLNRVVHCSSLVYWGRE